MGETLREHKNDTGPIVEAVERLTRITAAELVELPGTERHALRTPAGELVSIKHLIDEYAELPERVEGLVELHDLASFIAECARWKSDSLTVYVNAPCTVQLPARIVAVTNDAQPGKPAWKDHFLQYAPKLSPELIAWLKAANGMSQESFAEFIEDRLMDVRGRTLVADLAKTEESLKPLIDAANELGLQLGTQAELRTLSQGLDATVQQKIKARPNLQNGTAVFVFEEAVDTGPIVVPGGFIIEAPVFNGSPNVYMLMRLRYRITDGRVTWRVVVHDLDGIFREAVEQLRREIAEPGNRVVLGVPST